MSPRSTSGSDVLLVGGGIMSATLAALLHELEPDWSLTVLERLDAPALESSDAWNNAGTGHSALCELNYTPERPDGSVDIIKAVGINAQFQVSRQFWAHLVESGRLPDPTAFIRSVPHMSFVLGEEDSDYLRRRHEALNGHPLFAGAEFSTDPDTIGEWAPLLVRDRPAGERIAATRSPLGTDVDFGALSRALYAHLGAQGVDVAVHQEVTDLRRLASGRWGAMVHDLDTGEKRVETARFVFVGAGGGALHLLQKSGIPEGRGFGGFPVSGEFLRCTDRATVAAHHAKVYGKASVGAPPMSVPHLDTRVIDGESALLFGPYAGFSPKFLKTGHLWDLPASVRPGNVLPMLGVAKDNLDLVRYLVGQLLQSPEQRADALRRFAPSAHAEDWELTVAGQRVQVIKKTEHGGVLQFGTELVTGGEGTIAALLGASPGASTAVPIMLRLIAACFPDRLDDWRPQLTKMIPSYGSDLAEDPELVRRMHDWTSTVLHLDA